MKTICVMSVVGVMIYSLQDNAQGTFQNLNFESGIISAPIVSDVDAATALPRWTVRLNNVQSSTIGYDNRMLDLWGVSIHDSKSPFFQPIAGQYSVLLQGGHDTQVAGPAGIAQTGQIPARAQSLLFKASSLSGTFGVSFNGQPLSTVPVLTTQNYTIFGADLHSFAGQTGELQFTAPGSPDLVLLDDIQFSTQVIPEPSTFVLIAVAMAIFSVTSQSPRRKRDIPISFSRAALAFELRALRPHDSAFSTRLFLRVCERTDRRRDKEAKVYESKSPATCAPVVGEM